MTATGAELVKELEETPRSTEPAIVVGSYGTIFTALIVLAHLVFPRVSDAVWTAIYTIIAIFTPIVIAFFIRHKVWSPTSVKAVVDESVGNALDKARKETSQSISETAKVVENTDPDKSPF